MVCAVIPILYESGETVFTNNGIGMLSDILSCYATEERNGVFELEFKYPITGQFFSYIETDCIVKAKVNETSKLQLFRIYKHSKPIDGIVTFNAEHISYELNKNPIEEITIKN